MAKIETVAVIANQLSRPLSQRGVNLFSSLPPPSISPSEITTAIEMDLMKRPISGQKNIVVQISDIYEVEDVENQGFVVWNATAVVAGVEARQLELTGLSRLIWDGESISVNWSQFDSLPLLILEETKQDEDKVDLLNAENLASRVNELFAAWNSGGLDAAMGCYAEGIEFRDAANPKGLFGKEIVRDYLHGLFTNSPGMMIDLLVCDHLSNIRGIVAHWTASVPEKHEVATVDGYSVFEFAADGMILRHLSFYDQRPLFTAAGIWPRQ